MQEFVQWVLSGFPPWPWYTWTVIVLALLMGLGAAWHVAQAALGASVMVTSAAWSSLALGVQAVLRRWAPALTSHGSAHWATPHELRQGRVFLDTQIALARVGDEEVFDPAAGHCLVVGPPRSGKSRGIAMPTLRRWRGHVICTDLRGELLTLTGDARQGFSDVVCFDPSAPLDSPHHAALNVVDLVAWGTDAAADDVHRLVRHLVAPQATDPFAEAAVELLLAGTLHLHHTGTCSLPALRQWMTSTAPLRDKASEFLASPDAFVAGVGRALLDQSERLRSAIWQRALQPLLPFASPRVAHWTGHSDVPLRDLPTRPTPLSLYLAPTFSDIDRLTPLLGALVDGLVSVLGDVRTPPVHPTLLLLDEAMNLGHLRGLETGMSYLGGSGTRVMLLAQNLPQITQVYGPHTPLLASLSAALYFRPSPTDHVTAQHISDALGTTTVFAPGVSQQTQQSVSRGSVWQPHRVTAGGSQTASVQATGRPLLTNEEVRQLPFDAAIVVLAGLPPVLGQKVGLPGPTPLQRVWQQVKARPSAVAVPLAACLALAALHPLWWPLTPVLPAGIQAASLGVPPPAPQTEQSPLLPAPDVAPPVPVPSAPPVQDPTPTPAAAPAPQAPPEPPGPKWNLVVKQPGMASGGFIRATLPNEGSCLRELTAQAMPLLTRDEATYKDMRWITFHKDVTHYRVAWTVKKSFFTDVNEWKCEVAKGP
jgi:type IV secretory pathway TraG/TraD family ATPase VirD4